MVSTRSLSDIAIVGMSALFPGAKDLRSYWQNIINKVDAVRDASEQWIGPHFDPTSTENDRVYTRKGGFLEDLAEFDPAEFGIMPNSVDGGDPDHFLALKLARDALKDAGYINRPFNHQKTGIILGRGTYFNRGFGTVFQHGLVVDQTLELLNQLLPGLDPDILSSIRRELKTSLPPFTAEMAPGVVPNVVTGRIANRLNLMGPNYLIDAACASSLIAVELAMQELISGRCDLMLAGGVQASTPPQVHMVFCQLGALSRSRIRPFDQSADGTLLSEGIGVLVLKRLRDAQQDGDRIYAVIKAIASSSDGKGLGLLAPRIEGQVLALERAYQESGIDPKTITLVEAHGTGMPLGDQTEIQSITHIFGQRQGQLPHRALGSVKSMIGHCIPASGVASLIKTSLALYHKILPPTLCDQVNPDLGIEKSCFYLNTEARPWIHGDQRTPRRAGVNAFGFGGINAHAVLEEYPESQEQEFKTLHQQWPSELLVFSEGDRPTLITLIQKVQHIISNNPKILLAEIAYTLANRPLGSHRLAVVAKDIPDLLTKLQSAVEKLKDSRRTQMQTRSGIYYAVVDPAANPGKIAFLFPGEGSQYPNMLADLCLYFPKIRSWFDFADEIFVGALETLPCHSLFPPPLGLNATEQQFATDQLFTIEAATAIVFTASLGLYELLADFKIPCDMMVGHSTGENTALVASGTVRWTGRTKPTREIQHLLQIYCNLGAIDGIPKGQLLTVGAVDFSLIQQLLETFQGKLYLAMDNCPNQVILCGSADVIEQVAAQMREVGGICTRLPFDRAYHTPLFEAVVAALQPYYQAMEVGSGHTPLYSCATTDRFPTEPDDIRAVAAQQWAKTVHFRETIEKLYHQGARTFIEIGPSSSLTAFVDDTLADRDHLAIASNSQRRSGLEQIQHLLARLLVKGISVDLSPLYRQRELAPISLDVSFSADEPQPKLPSLLDLTMPVMRLAQPIANTLREKLQPVLPEIPSNFTGTTSQQPPSPPPQVLSIADPEQVAPETVLPNSNFYLPPDPRLATLTTHLELMQEFLASQARIASAFFSSPAPPNSSGDSSSLAVDSTAQSLQPAQQWPLLGQILTQDHQHLHCQRHFNLNYDLFIYDHTLGSQPSQSQPDLLPLPVIPFTVSMEILAEAASYLVGGQNCVQGLYNIRSYRWLALEQGQLTLDILAQLQPGQIPQVRDVHVQILQVDSSDSSNRTLVFEGIVRIADQFLPPPAPMAFHLVHSTPYSWQDEQLYKTGMFHGPQFQGVKHIRQVSKEGIEADLQSPELDNFFSHIQQPHFQIDAPLLDAVEQLVAYWVAEQIGMNFHTFPFQIKTFEQYRTPPPAGSNILCRGVMRFTHERQIEANYDLLDDAGDVIAHIEGLMQVFINLPEQYHQCFASPQTAYLSELWIQEETDLVVRRIAALSFEFLDELGGVIKQILVHLILDEQEREFWNSLPEKGPRRNEWLLGRIVAKDVLRQWASQTLDLNLAPADIQILPTTLGKPWPRCSDLENRGSLPDLSISHYGDHAIAAISLSGKRVGIDIQSLNSMASSDWLDIAFTPTELELFATLSQHGHDMGVISLGAWCAKEAAAKACGTGLQGNPQQWQVKHYDLTTQALIITRAGESFTVKLYRNDEEICAICHQ